MKKCFIFGALAPDMCYYPSPDDLVIAADKGLEPLKKLGIIPDIIIGDFDSLGYVPKGDNVKVLPVIKDDTDVGYSVKYGFENGFADFVIYGGIGGLLDHTFANLQLCTYISKRGGKVVLVGGGVFVTAVTDGEITIKNGKKRISVFSADTVSEGVTLKGLKYNLDNAELTSSFPLGVSNEFTENDAVISVKKGTLLIISDSKPE